MSFDVRIDCREVHTVRGHVYHTSDRPELPGSGPLPSCYFVSLEVPGVTCTIAKTAEEVTAAFPE